jgi:WD40 repeat protein
MGLNRAEFTKTFQELTPKPRTVLKLLLEGKTDEEVANAIGAKPATVRKHIQNLCDRFHIPGEVEGYKQNRREELIHVVKRYLSGNPVKPTQPKSTKVKMRPDWGEAIDVGAFYGREEELAKLEHWIVSDRCRLVAILGMGGIGKTALSLKLAERVSKEFDYIIWRTLRNAPSVRDLLADLIHFLSDGQQTNLPESLEERISCLIHYLRSSRCLVLLDNLETLLRGGDFAGNFCEKYEDYEELLRQVGQGAMGEEPHQSCLILTSREKPKEIAAQEGEMLPVRSFQLTGLKEEAKEILKTKGLSGSEDDYRKLVNRYVGNPLALKFVATTIQELFAGEIAEFLAQSTVIFGGIRSLLDQHFSRLLPLEEDVMYWLAINRDERISLPVLQKDILLSISSMELLEALESLAKRSLIETSAGVFFLQPVVLEYVTERLVEKVCHEIATQTIALLQSHALIKAQAKDYVRDTQIRYILKPIAQRLLKLLGSQQVIEQQLTQILDQVRGKSLMDMGYVAGNVVNLLRELNADLSGYDFSHLTVWQAYLQGVNLRHVNFAHANFARSVFTETFGNVLSVAFSPDGQVLATADVNGEIRTWQLTDIDCEQLQTYRGHDGWVWSVTFSPDGQTLASCGDDKTVRLWNIRSGQCLKVLQGHTSLIRSVAFSPDGHLLASGCDDKAVRLYDVGTGQCLQILQGHSGGVQSVTFSLDSQILASGSNDQTIKLWEVKTSQCLRSLKGHTDRVWSVAFSPDNQLLASGSDDQTILLWDVQTGQCRQRLCGHTSRVRSIAFSPDGRTLASGGEDQMVMLWDVRTGDCLYSLPGHTSRIWSVAFSPVREAFSVGEAFSEGVGVGRTLASGSEDQMVKLWNLDVGRCRQTLKGYTRGVRAVALSPDSQILASGGEDRIIRLWDVGTGQRRHTLRGHKGRIWCLSISPDGEILASGSDDRTIKLWSVNTGLCRQMFQGHSSWIRAVMFSPDGQTLASGSDDCTIMLWNISTGQCVQTFHGHTDWIWSLAFSSDGQQLASGSGDRTVKLWDVSTGQCVNTLKEHIKPVRSVAFSPKGCLLASGGDDRVVRVWDATTGECLKTLEGHVGWVRAVGFSPDGHLIASGGGDRIVRVWDIRTGETVHVLSGHSDRIRSLAFSQDGQLLASGSKDETIRLWDVKSGDCVKVIRSDRPYEGMNITGITGVTAATIATLKALGAVEEGN